jgi:hypothetical protein
VLLKIEEISSPLGFLWITDSVPGARLWRAHRHGDRQGCTREFAALCRKNASVGTCARASGSDRS